MKNFLIIIKNILIIFILINIISQAAHADNTTTISTTVQSSAARFRAPTTVFISDQIGYKFYTNDTNDGTGGRTAIAKTINGGSSWTDIYEINNDYVGGPVVWYDQWTPGDTTGKNIYFIHSSGSSSNDLTFFTLDTLTDMVNLNYSVTSGGGLSSTTRYSITKSTDGTLYIGLIDTSVTKVYKCTTTYNCGTGHWTDTSAPFTTAIDDDGDDIILRPLANGKVIMLAWDIGASSNNLYRTTYNGSNSWSSLTSFASATDSSTYPSAWGAVTNKSTKEVYLAYNSNVNNVAGVIKTVIFNGNTASTTKTNGTDMTSGTGFQTDLGINENNGDIYGIFAKDGTSSNEQFKVFKSTDKMSTWSAVTVTVTDNDWRGLSLNQSSKERIGATMRDNGAKDLFYLNIADPSAPVSTVCCEPSTIDLTTTNITIDTSVYTTDYIQRSPGLVFITPDNGYMFFNSSTRNPSYRKTTDGGANWGSPQTIVTATSSRGVVVWYDKWTPGSTGNKIHIIYGDTSPTPDYLNYIEFNTSNDTASTPARINNSTTNTIADNSRYSITKTADGTLWATLSGANGPLVKCTSSCTTGGNWTEVSYPYKSASATNHDLKLLPLKNSKLLALKWDITADTIYYSIYNSGTWSVNGSSLSAAVDDTTYLSGWGATVNNSNQDAYLCFNDNVNDGSGRIKTAIFNGSGLVGSVTNATGLQTHFQCDLAFNEHTGEVFLARTYVMTTSSKYGAVLMQKSKDRMQTWTSAERLSSGNTTKFSVMGMNFSSPYKIYTWYLGPGTDDIFGNDVVDIDMSRGRVFEEQSVDDILGTF